MVRWRDDFRPPGTVNFGSSLKGQFPKIKGVPIGILPTAGVLVKTMRRDEPGFIDCHVINSRAILCCRQEDSSHTFEKTPPLVVLKLV